MVTRNIMRPPSLLHPYIFLFYKSTQCMDIGAESIRTPVHKSTVRNPGLFTRLLSPHKVQIKKYLRIFKKKIINQSLIRARGRKYESNIM
ncbi:hypothetical protein GDO81_002986 [Engystomops pustulosus]|uniref:Uncharacterized protein n=1 Tax=Engystomops pustulosus TaxID=76066 RepID=A0AAV7DQP2_ENGPU|nr:hypothetical protein GDO81_002986 [Engystomops pustulosus]